MYTGGVPLVYGGRTTCIRHIPPDLVVTQKAWEVESSAPPVISWGFLTPRRVSLSEDVSHNSNNINELKFYH